jgi:plasmid stability protein
VTTLTIHDLPAELYERLAERAAASGRTIEAEAVACLTLALGALAHSEEELLRAVRELRGEVEAFVHEVEDESRP